MTDNAVPWDADIRARPEFTDALTDAAIAAALNAVVVPGPRQPVAVGRIVTYLRREGVWLAIKAAAAGGNPVAAAAVDLASDDHTATVDLDLPIVQTLLPKLAEAGLVTAAHLDAINAMADTAAPWWQTIGSASPLNEYDIARARAGG